MSEPNYLVAAFKMKPNLIFAGAGVAAGLVFGSPLLLGGVAALEVVYLATMSTHPRFRRAIRSLEARR